MRQRGRVQHGLLYLLQLLIGETDVSPMLGRVHFVQHGWRRSHWCISAMSIDEPMRQRGPSSAAWNTLYFFVILLLIGETDVGPMLCVFILSSNVGYDLTAVFVRCRSVNQCDNGVAFPALCATRFTFLYFSS